MVKVCTGNMKLFNNKKRQTEKQFKHLCNQADKITENTRNDIRRNYGLYFLTPEQKQELSQVSSNVDFENTSLHSHLQNEGFQLQDEHVEMLPKDTAIKLLRKSLTDSVAHRGTDVNDVQPSTKADQLVTEIFSLVGNPNSAHYFGIGSYFKEDPYFESGLIIIDDEKLLYFWFEEQD